MSLKHQLQHRVINLNYLMDHVLYQIFKIILIISTKKHDTITDNPPIENKIENKTTFRINAYYVELLSSETMKLLGSTKTKATRYENGGNKLHLEITEVVLLHCNIFHNDYQFVFKSLSYSCSQ